MQPTVRSYATAGLAVLSAGVIAVSPLAPVPDDIAIAAPAVSLAVNPADFYVAALEGIVNNSTALVELALTLPPAGPYSIFDLIEGVIADPAANIGEFLTSLANAPGLLAQQAGSAFDGFAAAVGQLAAGRLDLAIAGATSTTYQLLASILLYPISSVAELLGPDAATLTGLLTGTLLAGFAGPVASGLLVTGQVVQGVIDRVVALDPVGLVEYLAAVPAFYAEGIFNGVGGFSGILDPGGFSAPGPIAAVIRVAQQFVGVLRASIEGVTPLNITAISAPGVNEFAAPDEARLVALDVEAVPAAAPAAQPAGPAAGSGEQATSLDAVDPTGGGAASDQQQPTPGIEQGTDSPKNTEETAYRPGQRLRDAVKDVSDEVNASIENVRDGLTNLTGGGGGTKKEVEKADESGGQATSTAGSEDASTPAA